MSTDTVEDARAPVPIDWHCSPSNGWVVDSVTSCVALTPGVTS